MPAAPVSNTSKPGPSRSRDTTGQSFSLPADYQRWAELTSGGRVLGLDEEVALHVLPPSEVELATPIIAMCQVPQGDISDDWVVVAYMGDRTWYLVMDLHPDRLGKIYDGFWDIYASYGNCPVVATSFTDMLERAFASRGQRAWWLEDGFGSLGDAYDGEPEWLRPQGS